MRIYLVGFMGAGKSTVGRALAHRLRWPFRDLDREVERYAGATVPELIEQRGEEAFRVLEHEALERLSARPRAVVATGGGAFCRPENVELMKRTGTCVWLDPPLEVLFERVERSARSRPLFVDRERATALFAARRSWYGQAHLHIDTTGVNDVERVVDLVVEGLKEPGSPCAT
jgi:shikimate kinase